MYIKILILIQANTINFKKKYSNNNYDNYSNNFFLFEDEKKPFDVNGIIH